VGIGDPLACVAGFGGVLRYNMRGGARAIDPEEPAMSSSTHRPAACLLLLASVTAWAGAREDIQASMNKVLAARSYHATMDLAGSHPMRNEIDFVAPDRYRMTLPMGTQTIIGDTMIMNINGMQMKVPMPKGTLTRWRDPANMDKNMATMSVQALGADVVDGQPAKKYRVTNTQPQPSESTLWIGANGYPLQIQVNGKAMGKSTTTTIHYSRFNDPTLRVEAP